MFGPGIPTAPLIDIKSPAAGKTVQPRFKIKVDATDDLGIQRIELKIDGVVRGMLTMPPYELVAPDGIAEGNHMLEVIATDNRGTPGSKSVDFILGPPCTAAAGCSGGDVCVSGSCVAGPGVPGGLGDFCQVDTECLSGRCLADTAGNRACVEACDINNAGSCPNDFACIAAGAAGVCWPSEGGGCLGCASAGSGAAWPVLFGLGILVLATRRRRHA
jgi:MYXO-CTERM domain-containing protein